MEGLSTLLHNGRSHWLLSSLAMIITYFTGWAIYNLYFSPLSKIPGPLFARISAFPSWYHATTGNRHIWIWQCHQIYGDTFRFEPNGVIVNSAVGYSSIYNNKANVKKGKFYEIWSRNEREINTLGAVDKEIHAKKRKILTQVFSDRSVQSAEAFVISHVDRWCDIMLDGNGKDWSTSRNMADWCDYLVFDILGDLCFGRSFESTQAEGKRFREIIASINKYMAFMYPITRSPILNTWVWLKPRGLDSLLQSIAPPEIKGYYSFVEQSVVERTKLEEKLQKDSAGEKDMRKDMFHYLFNAKDSETGKRSYSSDELWSEANLLIIAGSSTTSTILSALFFYLARNPRAYSKLTTEIRTTFKSADDIKWGTSLTSCHYLRACLNETMRMSPAGPSELPREVLPGGYTVDGVIYPEGTLLGTSGWALNYNEDYFPDCNTYRPERWIIDEKEGFTAEDVARAQSAFFPFSSGPDTCVGKNLAWQELMITVGRTLRRMDIRLPPGVDVGGGAPELGWGRRNKNQYLLGDAWISLRDGPVLQFKNVED